MPSQVPSESEGVEVEMASLEVVVLVLVLQKAFENNSVKSSVNLDENLVVTYLLVWKKLNGLAASR